MRPVKWALSAFGMVLGLVVVAAIVGFLAETLAVFLGLGAATVSLISGFALIGAMAFAMRYAFESGATERPLVHGA